MVRVAISSALAYLRFLWKVALLHTSRYVIARDQFYQAFPRVSTDTGVRRPGYKAILAVDEVTNKYRNILQKGRANCTSDWLSVSGHFLAVFEH